MGVKISTPHMLASSCDVFCNIYGQYLGEVLASDRRCHEVTASFVQSPQTR
jgi:hypothetical protein